MTETAGEHTGPADLEAVVRRQAEALAHQAARMDQLLERVAALEAAAAPAGPPHPAVSAAPARAPRAPASNTPATPEVAQGTASRRQILGRGAGAAAGAVVGAVAFGVADASPAAAAPGVFTGDPAVDATADPGDGFGVRGIAGGEFGIGVIGYHTADTGGGEAGASAGVYGQTASVDPASGVHGAAIAETGEAFGVTGQVVSPTAIAIQGTGGSIGVKGTSEQPAGVGVMGESLVDFGGPVGVYGTAQSHLGVGVLGRNFSSSGSGVGVEGATQSAGGIGVLGSVETSSDAAVFSVGVTGTSIRGIGVSGLGGNAGLRLESPRAHVLFANGAADPLTSDGDRLAGEMLVDEEHVLWLCVKAGNPGTWRRIAGPDTAGALTVLTAPVRAYDSRPGNDPDSAPKTKLTPFVPRHVDLKLNGTNVPIRAEAALVSLLVVNPSSAGFLSVFKAGLTWPGTSNLNYASGQVVAVTTVTSLSSGFCGLVSSQPTDVVVDVIGYYL